MSQPATPAAPAATPAAPAAEPAQPAQQPTTPATPANEPAPTEQPAAVPAEPAPEVIGETAAPETTIAYKETGDAGLDLALDFMGRMGLGPEHDAIVAAAEGNFDKLEATLAAMGDKAAGYERYLALSKDAFNRTDAANKAKQAAVTEAVHAVAGSAENWAAIKAWAGKTATPEEKAEVNAHPLATKGRNLLKTASAREQSKGWWFNTEVVELVPTSGGHILVPDDILKLDPIAPQLNYAMRGGKLYRLSTGRGEDPYKFTAPVVVQLVRYLPFDDLPASAQDFISLSAQRDFMVDMDGDSLKISELKDQRREAWLVLNAEHIRAVDANLLTNPSTLATLYSLGGNVLKGLRHR